MSDPSNQIIEFFHHVDAATGGYPSHLLERLADKVWDSGIRYSRRVLFSEAERKIHEAGATVSDKASPRLIADIMRNADGVTDDAILDLWSTLLAKAASGDDKEIRPIYFEVIAKLSPKDALMLSIYGSAGMAIAYREDREEGAKRYGAGTFMDSDARRAYIYSQGITVDEVTFCYDALTRQGLLQADRNNNYNLTVFGKGFCQAVIARSKNSP